MAEENELKFPTKDELGKIEDFQIIEHEPCKGLNAHSYQVHRYSELVYLVSLLSSLNQDKMLLFRGQKNRYLNKGIPTFYPTIYRNIQQDNEITERFNQLNKAVELFQKNFPLNHIASENKTAIYQCLVQHYHSKLKVGTPWLDLTQSLRVATSFISESSGYVYIFALPYFKGAIAQEGNLNYVRLLSLSSSISLLPPLQEGYLISYNSIPKNCNQIKDYDFSKYLLAEVQVSQLGNRSYWHCIPPESLDKSKYDFINNNINELKEKINQSLKIQRS